MSYLFVFQNFFLSFMATFDFINPDDFSPPLITPD
jgi:hypothetical protein